MGWDTRSSVQWSFLSATWDKTNDRLSTQHNAFCSLDYILPFGGSLRKTNKCYKHVLDLEFEKNKHVTDLSRPEVSLYFQPSFVFLFYCLFYYWFSRLKICLYYHSSFAFVFHYLFYYNRITLLELFQTRDISILSAIICLSLSLPLLLLIFPD